MIKNDANVTVNDESDEDYQAETDDLFIENNDVFVSRQQLKDQDRVDRFVENNLNNLELAALAHEGNLLVKCIKVVKSYQ